MAKRPTSIRALQQRRRQLLERVDQLVFQRDLFRPGSEMLRHVAEAMRDLAATTGEPARRKSRVA
jgi:hypothetical protein